MRALLIRLVVTTGATAGSESAEVVDRVDRMIAIAVSDA